MSTKQILEFLNHVGWLLGVLPIKQLSEKRQKELFLQINGISTDGCALLFSNAGSKFWQQLQAERPNPVVATDRDNPVDTFSQQLIEKFIQRFLPASQAQIIYPGDTPVALIAMGQLVGWSQPSPLGMGIHSRYGPWFAYRAVIVLDNAPEWMEHWPLQPGAVEVATAHNSPCLTCSAPCANACPASAVRPGFNFNLRSCCEQRSLIGSPCSNWCHARAACPVGAEYSYDPAQLKYHMTVSLPGLKRWADTNMFI